MLSELSARLIGTLVVLQEIAVYALSVGELGALQRVEFTRKAHSILNVKSDLTLSVNAVGALSRIVSTLDALVFIQIQAIGT